MRFRSFRIPFWFFITGILWAIFNDPVISIIGKNLGADTKNIVRSLSDFVSVVAVTIILYFMIRRQNRRLEQSEDQYRQLFECNPNAMWIYRSDDLRFVKVNLAAIDMYGYTEEEFLAMSILDIRSAEDKEKIKDYTTSFNPGIAKAGNWGHLKRNGELLYTSIVAHELKFNNEACRLVMATNITDMILKEEKIKAQNATLHEIAWSNSHEIRRSLCSVMSLTTLLSDAATENERREYINLLQQCTQDFDEVLKKNNNKVDLLKETDSRAAL